ncbi:MAG: segregation/condensation protein A [Candidatus Diapherotrites archaeon]|nr:segregation/condensation protein A [Candidatus Diapherotrites archaeon]
MIAMTDVHDRIVGMIESPDWKAMLAETVKAESMDPWDIDVTILASRFMEKIREMRSVSFRVPANAVLASAILVRFKSDHWQLYPQEEFEEQLEDELGVDYRLEGQKVPNLSPSRRITRRRMTIDDLIHAVEDVMKKEKQRARSRVHTFPQELAVYALEDAEDYEERLEDVYQRCLDACDSEKLVMLSSLLKDNTRQELIGLLIPLLHLATQNRLVIWQEDFFKEVFISVGGVDDA